MVGDSESMVIVSMWASMAAWFTPIVLFGLMNLIVATIFIANNNNNRHDRKQILANNNNNNNRHDQNQGNDNNNNNRHDQNQGNDNNNNNNRHDQNQGNNNRYDQNQGNNNRYDQNQGDNNNKHYNQGEDQVYGDSSSRITIITSLFERAKSIDVTSYIAAITAAESRQKNPSPPKKATYSSLSRLAQSIYFPTIHGTRSNGGDLSQSESERSPPSKAAGAGSHLKRVKSVRFSSADNENTVLTEFNQISNSPGQLVRAPSFIERVKSFKISSPLKSGAPLTEPENIDTGRIAKPDHHATRSKSEKSSAKKAVVEIKKTRSEIRLPSDDEEDYDSRRPATAREGRNSGDAGVDAKADDFITRFRQQLKLQRVESLVRYNDILQGRTSN